MAESKTAVAKKRMLIRSQIRRAETLSYTYLECRVGGSRHRWDRVKPLFRFDVGVTIAYQCDRCYTIKHECISPKYGERLHRPIYKYPAGYELERPDNGEQVMSPAAVRATLALRGAYDESSLPEPRSYERIAPVDEPGSSDGPP